MSTFYTEISHINDLVNKVYNTENERLMHRKQGIDEMVNSQKRLIALNQSYTSKMRKYGFIIGIIASALVISVMIITFRSIMPKFIADLGIIIVVAGAIIWAFLIYLDIQRRDKVVFDELAIDSSTLINTANIEQSNNAAGNTGDISTLQNNLSFSAGCIGRNCCPTDWNSASVNNVYYNSKSNTCQVKIGSDSSEP
jgi:hypothetical protein